MNNGVMIKVLLYVVCFFLLVATTLAENVDCKIVVRDMYAADTQDAQNILVSMLKTMDLEGVSKLLASGTVTLFQSGEKVSRTETTPWGYDKITRPGETKTWLLSPQNTRPCGAND
jgi:hypothetical protein